MLASAGCASRGASPAPPARDGPGAETPEAEIPTCAVDPLSLFTRQALSPPWAGSGAYVPAPAAAAAALGASVRALAGRLDTGAALRAAEAAGYSVCRGAGAAASITVWRP
jgi:hypothetical protein